MAFVYPKTSSLFVSVATMSLIPKNLISALKMNESSLHFESGLFELKLGSLGLPLFEANGWGCGMNGILKKENFDIETNSFSEVATKRIIDEH